MANTHSLDLERGSSQYASIADGSQTGLDITGDITIEAWIKLESLPGGAGQHYTIAAKDDFSGVNRSFGFALFDTKKIGFYFVDGSGNVTFGAMDEVFDAGDTGVWMHVAVTADVSVPTLTFYKNGSAVASTTSATSATAIKDSTATFAVGTRFNTTATDFFDGLMDEVRVWDTIRSAGDILANYNKEISTHANLKGYWRLNNGYTDSSGNSNTLTATGSPVFSTDIPTFISSQIKKLMGVEYAKIKKVSSVAIASVKKVAGVA